MPSIKEPHLSYVFFSTHRTRLNAPLLDSCSIILSKVFIHVSYVSDNPIGRLLQAFLLYKHRTIVVSLCNESDCKRNHTTNHVSMLRFDVQCATIIIRQQHIVNLIHYLGATEGGCKIW